MDKLFQFVYDKQTIPISIGSQGGEIKNSKFLYSLNNRAIQNFYKNNKDGIPFLSFDQTFKCWIVSYNEHQNYMITEFFLKNNSVKSSLFGKDLYIFNEFMFGVNKDKYVYHILK